MRKERKELTALTALTFSFFNCDLSICYFHDQALFTDDSNGDGSIWPRSKGKDRVFGFLKSTDDKKHRSEKKEEVNEEYRRIE
jgi:hypothetical protein